jgi:hypothetical protein
MKRVSAIAVAVVTALLISLLVSAQPITGGGGLTRVNHSTSLFGSGTTASPLDLTHGCGSGQTLVWSGSAWACAAGGGGPGSGSATGPITVQDFRGTVISPTAITGTVSDWAPTSLSTATIVRVSTSGPAFITGITGGTAGRLLHLEFVGPNSITLVNQATSTLANQIITSTGVSMTFATDMDALLEYDGVVSRWRVVAHSIPYGAGLLWSSGLLTYDSTVLQSRVSTTCTSPNSITAISSTGVVTCSTGVVSGSGTANAIPKWISAGVLGNSAITDTGTLATIPENLTIGSQGALFSTYYGANSNGYNLFAGGGGQSSVGVLGATYQGSYNTSFGVTALNANTTGFFGTAIGYGALQVNTSGSQNTALGHAVLGANTTGGTNNGFGDAALSNNTTGSSNNGFGAAALQQNIVGTNNNAFGQQALQNNTANNNNAFGSSALRLNTTGTFNVAIGHGALGANTTGGGNSAIGYLALQLNTTSGNSTAIGTEALFNSTGQENTVVGSTSLFDLTTGDVNTAVGYGTGGGITTGRANTIIGSFIGGLAAGLSNNVIIGDGDGHIRMQTDSTGLTTFGSTVQIPTLDSMLVVRDAETNISLVGLTLIHDWDPFAGGAATPLVVATADPADTVIDGIAKPSYAVCLGAIGLHRLPRLRIAQSATNHGKIVLVNGEGSTSLAANQIWIQTNNAIGLSINHRGIVELEYDCLNGHWRLVGPTGSAWDGMLAFSDALTDTALAATVNDYSPALFGYVSMMRLGPAGGVSTITGMKALPDSGGRIQPIRCVTAFGTLVFSHNSASSLAGNRFFFPETRDLTLRAYQSACFRYDQGLGFWTIWTAPPLAVAAYAFNTLVKWNNQDEVTTSSISDTGTVVSTSSSISANGGLTIAGQYTFLGRQVFSITGTYTPTAGARVVKIRACGGGGGSGGAKSSATGGGSSGSYLEVAINPGAAITGGAVTIGAAGTAGALAPTNGGNGGDTSIVVQAVTYTAKGGGGSIAGSSNVMLGAAGQVGSSAGDVNQTGNPGGFGAVIAGTYVSGNGGSSPFGSGGVGVRLTAGATAGNPGLDACAGASGGADFAGAGVAGGAGSKGAVIIEEYK